MDVNEVFAILLKRIKLSSGGGVTGVKGNKESTYRAENVNLTPENIGALPTTGGTINGNLRLQMDGENYGNKLNFGDSDFVYLHEYDDDHLQIYANSMIKLSSDEIIVNKIHFDNDSDYAIYPERECDLGNINHPFQNLFLEFNDISDLDGIGATKVQMNFDPQKGILSMKSSSEYVTDQGEICFSTGIGGNITIRYLDYGIPVHQLMISDMGIAKWYYDEGSQKYLNDITVQFRNKSLSPISPNTCDLGATAQWRNIYAVNGIIQTSDRNEKNTIEELDSQRAQALIYGLKPSTYQMNAGTSGRTHWGMISQDIEELFEEIGMTSLDFAGFIKSPKVQRITTDENGKELQKPIEKVIEGEYDYSLRYDEFIAPIIKVIQSQHNEIEMQNEHIETLEEKIEMLEQKITALI